MPTAVLSQTSSAKSRRSSLPSATIAARDTFKLFGCSYSTGMSLVQAGRFPVKPIRLGRILRFKKSEVFAYLGIDDPVGDPTAADAA